MFPHLLYLLSSQETVISILYLTRVVAIVTLSADVIPPKQCATLEVPENTPLLSIAWFAQTVLSVN